MSEFLAEQLQALGAGSLNRVLRGTKRGQGPIVDLAGQQLINFSWNDYLALANDPKPREAAIATSGVGARSRADRRTL
jgi:7-keto-8-aminopelargonate synthetase-like enzyme